MPYNPRRFEPSDQNPLSTKPRIHRPTNPLCNHASRELDCIIYYCLLIYHARFNYTFINKPSRVNETSSVLLWQPSPIFFCGLPEGEQLVLTNYNPMSTRNYRTLFNYSLSAVGACFEASLWRISNFPCRPVPIGNKSFTVWLPAQLSN